MAESTMEEKVPSDQELIEEIEQFKQANPHIARAMRIFDLSNDWYQASLTALYGPHISWSNSANDAITRSP